MGEEHTPCIKDDKFWESRGISEEVRNARPYIGWYDRPSTDSASVEALVNKHYPKPTFTGGQQGFLKRMARQGAGTGFLIVRHPANSGLGRIYPEMRPDRPVTTDVRYHFHGEGEPPKNYVTKKGKRRALLPRDIYDPVAMEQHIERGTDPRKRQDDDHCGVNTEEVHCHRHDAKYLFPPSGKYWTWETHKHASIVRNNWPAFVKHMDEEHANDFEAEVRDEEGNVLAYLYEKLDENGELVNPLMYTSPRPWEEHTHRLQRKVNKYNYAARVDFHPMVHKYFHGRAFREAEVVFFALEGCLKADAILSAGYPVVSVPSVSLWNTKEMADQEFLRRYFGGKTVAIVPDGDWLEWHLNRGAVIRQARFLQAYLTYRGINAVVASTPKAVYEASDGKIKGVDDYLGTECPGFGKGDLMQLEVVEHEIPKEHILEKLSHHVGNADIQADQRDKEVLLALSHYALDGKIEVTYPTLARMVELQGLAPILPGKPTPTSPWTPKPDDERSKALDSQRKRVKKAVTESLQGRDMLTVTGKFDVRINPYNYEFEWVSLPTITLADEFRPTVRTMSLDEYLGQHREPV